MGPDRVATMLRKHFPRKVQTLSLRYVGVDGEEQLSEWEWEEHRETGDAVTELGRTIWESAQSHCEEVQTACRFALVGVAKDGSQIARQIMRQTPEDVAGVPPRGGIGQRTGGPVDPAHGGIGADAHAVRGSGTYDATADESADV